jgi:hypothetical protein
MKIVGYGICGSGEADRYLKLTLDNFKALCDETIILCNNTTEKEEKLIKKYKFHIIKDEREWGKNQHHIKEDFLKNHVAKLNPDATLCLDMDEVLEVTRQDLEEYAEKGQAWYVYIANLWNEGYRSDWSFWNVRFWCWQWKEKLGDGFFKFENRPLHCGLAPKWCYTLNLHAPFLLTHYGLKEKENRMRKVARYEKYDPNQVYRSKSYYEALKTDHCEPYLPESIKDTLRGHIEALKQPLNKELGVTKGKNKCVVMREYDGFVFEVDEGQLKQQLSRKFKGQGFTQVT